MKEKRISEKIEKIVSLTEESSTGYIQLGEHSPWYKEQRIILRNGDGSEAIIPADLLPESQRDNGGCIDAVEAVKHLVEIIRKYEQEKKDLWKSQATRYL